MCPRWVIVSIRCVHIARMCAYVRMFSNVYAGISGHAHACLCVHVCTHCTHTCIQCVHALAAEGLVRGGD